MKNLIKYYTINNKIHKYYYKIKYFNKANILLNLKKKMTLLNKKLMKLLHILIL